MDIVNKIFLKKTKDISFIQLKHGANIKFGSYMMDENIPFPIETSTLIDKVGKGEVESEFEITHIIDGIIYMLGIDKGFRYNENYRQVLYSFNNQIEDYILAKGDELTSENRIRDGAIFFRALVELNSRNIIGLFKYSLALERIAIEYFDLNKSTEGNAFLMESTKQLEKILNIEDSFALAYYKLGYHYKHYGEFQKAKLVWDAYLKIDKDNQKLNEVKEQLEIIMDNVSLEQSINYLENGQYVKVLKHLIPLSRKHENHWNIFYLIGLAYKGMGKNVEAIDFLYKALNLNRSNVDIYNELGICLLSTGEVEDAIDIFSLGIKQQEADYRIVFNRGLAYLQLGVIDRATKDVKTAYKLNPNDSVVRDQMKELEGYIF